jgi:hypothetical protein
LERAFSSFGNADETLISIEIGSKYGPFDLAMIPIWRGGTFAFIAHLGFHVCFSLLPYLLDKKTH